MTWYCAYGSVLGVLSLHLSIGTLVLWLTWLIERQCEVKQGSVTKATRNWIFCRLTNTGW
jgi:hypothetical protein